MKVPQHLTSMRIFLSLLPPAELWYTKSTTTRDITVDTEKRRAQRLLLYPPDMFAFTSAILGTTGAYYLVVSPANATVGTIDHKWPPEVIKKIDPKGDHKTIACFADRRKKSCHYSNDRRQIKQHFDADDCWPKRVAQLGASWRRLVSKRFSSIEPLLNSFDKYEDPQPIVSELKTPKSQDKEEDLDCKNFTQIAELFDLFLEGADENDVNELLCRREDVVKSLMIAEGEDPDDPIVKERFISKNTDKINKRLDEAWNAYCALVTLHAVADEACLGFGIRKSIAPPGGSTSGYTGFIREDKKGALQLYAEGILARRGTLATIHPDRCRILPKRHTPNVGMTLRSLSSNLAFTRSSVSVKWRESVDSPVSHLATKGQRQAGPVNISTLNVLLVPCPLKISPRDFKVVPADEIPRTAENERYFEYSPVNDFDAWSPHYQGARGLERWLSRLFAKAKEETGRIDMVIFPETALTYGQLEQLEKAIKKADQADMKISGYIAGVRADRDKQNRRLNRNFVVCKMRHPEKDKNGKPIADAYVFDYPYDAKLDFDQDLPYIQHKHHRWKVGSTQIIQYQLGGVLTTEKTWWEAMKVSQRKVTFMNIGENITICPLICEDLARQEPISDLIRAVGPTLVVSLLMDGPQLADRWSAGYAGILSDDPRSSVLTLTCAGLVDRWRSSYRGPSRVVAYWKDNLNYRTEIELEKGKDAIMLYLNTRIQRESTADGRKEHIGTPYLVYGGMDQISV